MKVFHLFCPPALRWKNSMYVDDRWHVNATHKWGLPGVKCPIEGGWSTMGVAYPQIDLSQFAGEERYRNGQCIPYEQFERERATIRALLPGHPELHVGAEFGPLLGEADGEFDDFCLFNPWTLLVRSGALRRLEDFGIRSLVTARTELAFKDHRESDLLEVFAAPRARLSESYFPDGAPIPCPVCGRVGVNAAQTPVILDGKSVPQDLEVFRGDDLTTFIFCTEYFREAVLKLQLIGLGFEETPVV